jgi:hypothetical protein
MKSTSKTNKLLPSLKARGIKIKAGNGILWHQKRGCEKLATFSFQFSLIDSIAYPERIKVP